MDRQPPDGTPRGFHHVNHPDALQGDLFLHIIEMGCTDLCLIGVTGPLAGRMLTGNADGFWPPNVSSAQDFLSWYERWLDHMRDGKDNDALGLTSPATVASAPWGPRARARKTLGRKPQSVEATGLGTEILTAPLSHETWRSLENDGKRMVVGCTEEHLAELVEQYKHRPFVEPQLWAGKIARALQKTSLRVCDPLDRAVRSMRFPGRSDGRISAVRRRGRSRVWPRRWRPGHVRRSPCPSTRRTSPCPS